MHFSRPHLLILILWGIAVSMLLWCGVGKDSRLGKRHPPGGTRKDLADPGHEVLVPDIPELGVPTVFYRECWPHAEAYEMMQPVGEPFPSSASWLYVAIWPDGTVIWGNGLSENNVAWEGRLKSDAVAVLLSAVPLREGLSREAKRYLKRISSDWYLPVSVIGIRGETGYFLFYSHLDQMEKVETYWYWHDNGDETEFPFSQYSFEQFCNEVPDWYAQYQRAFNRLRIHLKSLIPSKGDRVVLADRIRCVKLEGRLGDLQDAGTLPERDSN